MKNYRLVKARKDKNYSQEQLANQIGISTSAYIVKENGKQQFKLDEINIILEILNVSYDDIFLINMSQK